MKNLLLFITLIITGCGSVYSVIPVGDTDISNKKGITYYLPRNVVKVTISGTETVIKPGRFSNSAEVCFLEEYLYMGRPYDSNPKTPEIDFPKGNKVIDGATFELTAEKDKPFFVSLRTPINPFASRSGSFSLDESQILTQATAKGSDNSFGFFTSVVKSLLAAPSGGATSDPALVEGNSCPTKAIDFIGIMNTLVEQRVNLISGNTRVSHELYNKMLADISTYEKEIMDMFFL